MCDGFVLDAGPQVKWAHPCCVHIRTRTSRTAAALSVTRTVTQGELAFPYPEKGYWALSAPTNLSEISNRSLFLKVSADSFALPLYPEWPSSANLCSFGFLGAHARAPSGCLLAS